MRPVNKKQVIRRAGIFTIAALLSAIGGALMTGCGSGASSEGGENTEETQVRDEAPRDERIIE